MGGCDYPAIVPSPNPSPAPHTNPSPNDKGHNGKGPCVRGTYVEGLTEADMWRLDIFEGGEYVRRKVVCRLVEGEGEGDGGEEEGEVEAETYVWRDGEVGLEGGEWDFEEFRREKMGRWVGGREEFDGQ